MTMHKDDKKIFERELEDYRDQVWGCARCNWCQNQWGWSVKNAEFSEICPAFHEYRFFPYSGMGKMHMARAIIEGDFDYEDAPELAEFIYTCTTCGACEMNCQRLQDKEPLKVNEALRARLVRDGIGPMPAHQNLIKSIRNYDNPWMQPRTQRDKWMRNLNIKDVAADRAETLFFVGCTTALDATMLGVAQNTARLLLAAGVDLGTLGKDEICCGSPVARVGDRETFAALARRTVDILNKTGAREIVTACPGCYRALLHDYPEVPGVPPIEADILHAVHYIDRLIAQGKLVFKKSMPMKVTWHDPCHLGRHCGIYDAPRNILRAIPGIELVEKERNRDQSWCCGGGGGARAAFPDFAAKTAEKLINEAKKTTGADAIVTCCPFCEVNIGDVLHRTGNSMKLFNLIDLVAQAAGINEKPES
jgi:heterodisulfide reductase subunit D